MTLSTSMGFSSLFALLLTINIALPVKADGGFTNSCYGQELFHGVGGYYLGAHCYTSNGGNRWSLLHLGDCVGNRNGALVPEAGGTFGNSCSQCGLFISQNPCAYSPACLVCDACGNGHGGSDESWIGLDGVVGNNNGYLVCNGGQGT